jgi:uncharacterized membrane protein SirB2
MYFAFKHAHLLTAVLSMIMTVIWTVKAWNGQNSAPEALSGNHKLIYILHRASAGIAGLTGLAVTVTGPWMAMLFPYVGLCAFLVHGYAASISKKTFGDRHNAAKRRVALAIQLLALLFSAFIMAAKPIVLPS